MLGWMLVCLFLISFNGGFSTLNRDRVIRPGNRLISNNFTYTNSAVAIFVHPCPPCVHPNERCYNNNY